MSTISLDLETVIDPPISSMELLALARFLLLLRSSLHFDAIILLLVIITLSKVLYTTRFFSVVILFWHLFTILDIFFNCLSIRFWFTHFLVSNLLEFATHSCALVVAVCLRYNLSRFRLRCRNWLFILFLSYSLFSLSASHTSFRLSWSFLLTQVYCLWGGDWRCWFRTFFGHSFHRLLLLFIFVIISRSLWHHVLFKPLLILLESRLF